MSFLSTKMLRLLSRPAATAVAARPLSTAADARTQKLERIADDLIALTKIERDDYNILLRHKLGLGRWVSPGGIAIASPGGGGGGAAAAEEVKEKTAFDVKLDKFEAASKIKVIKEVRAFTDLGLKEAKELVEKAPVFIKRGITKEEAEQILAKLKDVGATVVME